MKSISKASFNIADLYIILWCAYLQQGGLFPEDGAVFKVLLFLLWMISFYYVIKTNSKYKTPPYFRGLGLFLVVLSIYGIVQLLSGEVLIIKENGAIVPRLYYLKSLYNSLLPIYAFYCFGKNGYITKTKINIYSIVFIILAIVTFLFKQRRTLAVGEAKEALEMTNNVGYVFISIIPLITLTSKNILKYLLLAVCLMFTLLSMKRGAILIGVVATTVFLINTFKHVRRREKVIVILAIVGICVGLYFVVMNLFENNVYFQVRLDRTLEGDSSNRDDLYGVFWNHFYYESSFLNQLFGNGAFATVKVSTNYAHNDWFELLINQGVFGIVLYLIYWVLFYKTWRMAKKKCDNMVITALLLIMVIYFLKTLFSMSYYDMTIYATFTLGYCLSQINVNIRSSKQYINTEIIQ